MILSTQIQSYYNKLYKQLRKYFWSFQVVENIAYLEMECYKAIPSIENIRIYLEKIKRGCAQELKDDEELRSAYESMCNYIENSSNKDVCMRLTINKEVFQ